MPTPATPLPAKDWPIPPMDHGAGDKPSAFTWAMGRLILQRMGDRETMAEITADPRMPAYCTVFRWVQVVPSFGAAYRQVRLALAQVKQAEADDRRAAVRARRHWVSGRKSSYTPALGDAVCQAIEDGATLSVVAATAGMPSSKTIYRWMRRFPAFKAQYVEACRRRIIGLQLQADCIAMEVTPATLAAAKRATRWIDGRIGRLTPKTYRSDRPTLWR